MTSNAAVLDPPAADPVDPPAAPPASDPPVADPPAADPPAADPPADDWRARLAGGDDKLLGYLAKVSSEQALVERLKKHHDDIKQGKYLTPLGDDPTEEEIAAYRAATGVPENPDGYMEKLPDGLVVGDDDRPFVDRFLGAMHAVNAPPAMANAALETYYAIVEEQAAEQLEAAAAAKKECEDTLREEWAQPGEYRRMDNILQNFVSGLPEAVRDAFDKGTGPDGVPLGYNPEIRRWLVAEALEKNPLATVVPGAGANQASAIADEIAALEKRMRDDRKAYFKDEKAQARYLELVAARDKLAERAE